MAHKETSFVADKMCIDHCDEMLDMYCRGCKVVTCETCVKLYHLQHDWCKLSKIVNEFQGHAKEKARLIREDHIFGLRRNLTTILSLKNENATRNFRNISCIIRKKERMIEALNEISDRLIKKCENDHAELDEKLSMYESELLRRIADCEDVAYAYERSSGLISGYQYVRMEQRLQAHYHMARPLNFRDEKDMPTYTDNPFDHQKLEEMFRKVTKSEKPDFHRAVCERSNAADLYTLFPMAENQAWENVRETQRNMLVTNMMNMIELSSACVDADCISFLSLDNGDQIFARLSETRVCKMKANGSFEELRNTFPFSPSGLSRAVEHGVLLSLVNKKKLDAHSSTYAALLHLSEDGTLMKRYDVDKETNMQYFPVPFKVVQNNNTDLCIVDYMTNDQTQLRVLTYGGKFRFEFRGRNLRANQKLDIAGLCCDSRCRIILSDCRNHTVYWLNHDGAFLGLLLSRDDGLEYPFALTLYKNTLWVNCAFGKTKILKYEK